MKKLDKEIDELIQQVRTEVMEEVRAERDVILNKARAEAREIIETAVRESNARLLDTQAEIAKRKKQLDVQLELAARDFSLMFDERLRSQMFFPIVKEKLRATLKQPDFLKEVLQRLIVEYVKDHPCNLDVLVPKELRTTLAAFFAGAVFDHLDKACDIRLVDDDGIEGFVLIKRGEHFVWDFRLDTIAKEIMRLMDPSLKKYFIAKTSSSNLQP